MRIKSGVRVFIGELLENQSGDVGGNVFYFLTKLPGDVLEKYFNIQFGKNH